MIKCPWCASPHTTNCDAGERAGSELAGLFGAAAGAASAMRSARLATIIGPTAGRFGAAVGGFGRAILTGVFTGSVAGAIGGLFGRIADREWIRSRMCLKCGCRFRESDALVAAPEQPPTDPELAPGSGGDLQPCQYH